MNISYFDNTWHWSLTLRLSIIHGGSSIRHLAWEISTRHAANAVTASPYLSYRGVGVDGRGTQQTPWELKLTATGVCFGRDAVSLRPRVCASKLTSCSCSKLQLAPCKCLSGSVCLTFLRRFTYLRFWISSPLNKIQKDHDSSLQKIQLCRSYTAPLLPAWSANITQIRSLSMFDRQYCQLYATMLSIKHRKVVTYWHQHTINIAEITRSLGI